MKKSYVQEIESFPFGRTEVSVFAAQKPDQIAKLAIEVATKFALVAGVPDGEDSAGRQKLRLPTAEELAVRACNIAEALWNQLEKRDLLLDLPEPKQEKPSTV